jgi:tetraacyldisaccharide 4'-kinase
MYMLADYINRDRIQHQKFSIPVICIGNLVVGGGGKTPAVIALVHLLKQSAQSFKPCILTRGYGGKKTLHIVMDSDTAEEVGDEACLLRRSAPVIIAADRVRGAKLAEERGFNLIIMDDGYQNPSLYKNLSFLVIDGIYGFGNGHVIPAGPLREPIDRGLERAQGIILVGADQADVGAILPPELPVFKATIHADFKPVHNQKYVAFCGLAQPDKFRSTLADLSVKTEEFISFPDHHPFSSRDISYLESLAVKHGARLLTTEKDFVRLSAYPHILSLVTSIPISMVFANEDKLLSLIMKGIGP